MNNRPLYVILMSQYIFLSICLRTPQISSARIRFLQAVSCECALRNRVSRCGIKSSRDSLRGGMPGARRPIGERIDRGSARGFADRSGEGAETGEKRWRSLLRPRVWRVNATAIGRSIPFVVNARREPSAGECRSDFSHGKHHFP